MKIDIVQTKGNFTNEYEIGYDGSFTYTVKQSLLNRRMTIKMTNLEGEALYSLKHKFCGISEFIPLGIYLPSGASYSVSVIKGNEIIGTFCHTKHPSFASEHTAIYYLTGECFYIHRVIYKHNIYLCVFNSKNTQVAIIKRHYVVKDNCDTYWLYLLDEYKAYSEFLTLFTVFYDVWFHNNSLGSASWGYSQESYHRLGGNFSETVYDPQWVKENFNEEW